MLTDEEIEVLLPLKGLSLKEQHAILKEKTKMPYAQKPFARLRKRAMERGRLPEGFIPARENRASRNVSEEQRALMTRRILGKCRNEPCENNAVGRYCETCAVEIYASQN